MTTAPSAIRSAFFITFNGNCQEALLLYQDCFGGKVQFDTFPEPIGFKKLPVVSGYLYSDPLLIQASDLIQEQGRRVGNQMAILVTCESHQQRLIYLKKLSDRKQYQSFKRLQTQKLIEITDRFDVSWIFGVV